MLWAAHAAQRGTATALLALVAAVPSGAQPWPPVRLSVSTTGEQADGESRLLNINRAGRFVLFRSVATNMVPGDTNGVDDLFVRDRDTDADGRFDEPGAVATVRVSVGTNGEQADRTCADGWLSQDGRYVLFQTDASTLVAGDTNGVDDVFLRDRDTDGDGFFDEPGTVSTTRISEGNDGVQADGGSFRGAMTPDARYVLFASGASNLTPVPVNGVSQLYRKDRLTGVLALVTGTPDGLPATNTTDLESASISADGQVVVFVALTDNLVPGGFEAQVFIRDLRANTLQPLPPPPSSLAASIGLLGRTHEAFYRVQTLPLPGITPDGSEAFYYIRTVVNLSSLSVTGQLYSYVRETGEHRALGLALDPLFADGAQSIAFTKSYGNATSRACVQLPFVYGGLFLFDRRTATTSVISDRQITRYATSGSQRRALIRTPSTADCVAGQPPPAAPTVYLIDRRYGAPVIMPRPVSVGQLDQEGSQSVFETSDATIVPNDTNAVSDVFAVDLESRLDQDSDGLDDGWEAATGLSYVSAAGVDGPAGDPDGDGLTNLQELQAGSHPRGTHVRYLAEGADNAFFRTRIALANPGTNPATVILRFLVEGSDSRSAFVTLPAQRRRTLDARDVPDPPSQPFSIVVESDAEVAVDRTMSWDATGYGAHAERALAGASTTWFLAEGSTAGEFALFYVLQNPGDTSATATIRYLRPAGQAPIERTYVLPPQSRTTIPVNTQAPELASTDVSAAITADSPILVERSMYLNRGGQPFAAGHNSAGVTAASTSWFLAEGATGPFFDLFVLVANPNATAAIVEARYLTGGEVLTKTYEVAANSRLTIYVDSEEFPGRGRALASVDVSTTLTSTNGVPIVVERAMWFPGPEVTPDFWSEAHNSPGSTMTATRWVVADGEEGGPTNVRTFVLVANTSPFEGRVRVTALREDGLRSFPKTYVVPPNSRTTIPVGQELDIRDPAVPELSLRGQRFAVLVESVETPTLAQLVVERAMYWDAGGVVWAAGTAALGTPLPNDE